MRLRSQNVLVKGVEQIFRQLIGRQAHHLGALLALATTHLDVQADHTIGKRSQSIWIIDFISNYFIFTLYIFI